MRSPPLFYTVAFRVQDKRFITDLDLYFNPGSCPMLPPYCVLHVMLVSPNPRSSSYTVQSIFVERRCRRHSTPTFRINRHASGANGHGQWLAGWLATFDDYFGLRKRVGWHRFQEQIFANNMWHKLPEPPSLVGTSVVPGKNLQHPSRYPLLRVRFELELSHT